MNILLFILFGAIVGWLASVIMKTNDTQGILGDVILGIIGAFVGGYLMDFLGFGGVTGFNIYSMLVALIGAIVVVMLGRMLRGVFR